MKKKPAVLSTSYLHRGFFDVRQDLLSGRESGDPIPYISLILPSHAAVVLAQNEEGLWILNREYRHPTGEHILGCPGGRLEEGELPFIGAQRELLEETGYWAEELIQTGFSYPFPSLSNQKIYFFWAPKAIKKGSPKLDPLEFIETELKSDSELREELASQPFVDSLLSSALWYRDHYLKTSLKGQ